MPVVAPRDWCDGAAYDRLLPAGRHAFAWEWLRRTPAYRAAWTTPSADPAAFGLIRFEDPTQDALVARPIWHADVDRAVLRGVIVRRPWADRLALGRLSPLVSILPGAGDGETSEHILLSDGLHAIRIDLAGGSLVGRPAALRWRIDGLALAGPQLLALRQLISLAETGRFARSLHRPERRAHRWIAMLRVHDALAAGASHREIVAGLFGIDVAAPRWRASAGPWRLRVQRLAAGARRAIALGPAAWLSGQ